MLGDSPALKAAIRVFGLQGPVGRGPLWQSPAEAGLRQHEHATHAPAGARIGEVNFPTSCSPDTQRRFNQAVWTLHSFWYEESLKEFTAIGEAEPSCAIAYWGIAMSNWYPLWYPPTPAMLRSGAAAVEKGLAVPPATERERAYLEAMLRRFSEMLEPGGTLAFGNFGQENGSRSYMEIVGRWFLIYRSPMDLMRLAATAGFLPRKTRVCTDATGLNNFLITTKAA